MLNHGISSWGEECQSKPADRWSQFSASVWVSSIIPISTRKIIQIPMMFASLSMKKLETYQYHWIFPVGYVLPSLCRKRLKKEMRSFISSDLRPQTSGSSLGQSVPRRSKYHQWSHQFMSLSRKMVNWPVDLQKSYQFGSKPRELEIETVSRDTTWHHRAVGRSRRKSVEDNASFGRYVVWVIWQRERSAFW